MNKAVGYIRISTQEQSLIRQKEDLEIFAESKNFELVKIFKDIISGSKKSINDRNEFIKMENYLKESTEVKDVLVLELSRLGRRNNEIQNVVEQFSDNGINIHIQDINISTLNNDKSRSISSSLLIGILGVMAANESRQLSSRIKSGLKSKAIKNKVFGGKITGYKKGKNGSPEIDHNESKIIERIFELGCSGYGARLIIDTIKVEFARDFSPGTINGIIRNSFYMGIRRYKELELDVPAIVSEDVWRKANQHIDSRKKFNSRNCANVNVIQGKIHCNDCSNIMHQIVNPNARTNQYRCKNKECGNTVNREWLYDLIYYMADRIGKKKLESDEIEKVNQKIKVLRNKILASQTEVEKLKTRKSRLNFMYLDMELSSKEYKNLKNQFEKSIDKTELEILKIKRIIENLELSLNNENFTFSEDLNIFKTEIYNYIKSVRVSKQEAYITMLDERCVVKKPSGAELGWIKRKKKKGIKFNPELYNINISKIYNEEDFENWVNNFEYELNFPELYEKELEDHHKNKGSNKTV